ncbi:MAG: Crp/Fnr family transcriptional regulator [Cytophagaceae bacterium]|nr:Crp/Fnr family transcriptional regulator [Cytophagaceae bacterium]
MEERGERDLPGLECCIFKDLDTKSLNVLNKAREIATLKKGDYVYREGNLPTGVYCVHEGHIKAFKVGSDGKEQIIYLAKPGDLIGWQQLTCDDPYSTSAVALEKAVVSHIPREIFVEIVRNSTLSLALTKYICEDVIMLESKVLELSQKSVRERLATNIIMLHQKFGIKHGNKIVIGVPLTREDLANLIGTNTETVIKLLSEFRREGHIEFIEKKIFILNLNALKKFSDFYG